MTWKNEGMSSSGTVGRRPYQTPRLSAVSLAADEVLETGCKMANYPLVPGQNHNAQYCGIPAAPCYGTGS